jgi:hypothetical protein
MTVDTRDILLKAAEDVTQGMWCRGHYFMDEAEELFPEALFRSSSTELLDLAQNSRRCAHGSLVVATLLLGGSLNDYTAVDRAVHSRVTSFTEASGLIAYNDDILPDDPFEAGQQLAELFRMTVEAL